MSTPDPVPFPRLVRLIRKSRGLSLQRASDAIGVSRDAWAAWEAGVAPYPGVEKSVREWCAPGGDKHDHATSEQLSS